MTITTIIITIITIITITITLIHLIMVFRKSTFCVTTNTQKRVKDCAKVPELHIIKALKGEPFNANNLVNIFKRCLK